MNTVQHNKEEPPNDSVFLSAHEALHEQIMQEYIFLGERPAVFLPDVEELPFSAGKLFKNMRAITASPYPELFVISNTVGVIPLSMEAEVTSYHYPTQRLVSRQREYNALINRVSAFLMHMHECCPSREIIYYVGGQRHYIILTRANVLLGIYSFKIVARVAFGSAHTSQRTSYVRAAKELAMHLDMGTGGLKEQ